MPGRGFDDLIMRVVELLDATQTCARGGAKCAHVP
jgi:hypothetical protein